MQAKKLYRTDHLFANTNSLIGVGTIFNIVGNYFDFNRSKSIEEVDFKAIESDWGTIGLDINKVINENPKEKFKENINR